MKKDIRALSFEEIKDFFLSKEEKAFRAKQVYEWLWKKSARSFDEMSNLSKSTREWLKENFSLNSVSIAGEQRSHDRTIKYAFRLFDGNLVEGVLIPTTDRTTACISTQCGCSLTCRFCATGKLGLTRNLDAGEMYDQVALIKKQAGLEYGMPLSNIVFMGMGEPLLNYSSVLNVIGKITSPEGLAMSPRRITVSTSGISKMIKKAGDDNVKFNLALSLNAATDGKRNSIMPINEHNSLKSLSEAIVYFHAKTGSRVTIEYILFKNFNDDIKDAMDLAQFTKAFPCKVNLIEYNTIEGGEFEKADKEKLDQFAKFLEGKNMVVNIRRSRGKDISAACGQLAGKKL